MKQQITVMPKLRDGVTPDLVSFNCLIAAYTATFIEANMGVPADRIVNVYNGTDTTRFCRTDAMAAEATARYPLTPGCFAVGCIGSFEPRKGQAVLLKAIAKP